MVRDNTGIILTPGNNGTDCIGNGQHYDESGSLIECRCDECDYALCCVENACEICTGSFGCSKTENPPE